MSLLRIRTILRACRFFYLYTLHVKISSIKESSVISSISQPHPCCGFKSSICNLPDITLKAAWGWGMEKVSTAGSAWNPARWSQPSKPYPGSKVYLFICLFVCFNHRPFFLPLFNSRFFEHKNNVFSSITKFWILGRYCRFLIHNEVSISVHTRVHDQPVRTFPKKVFFLWFENVMLAYNVCYIFWLCSLPISCFPFSPLSPHDFSIPITYVYEYRAIS